MVNEVKGYNINMHHRVRKVDTKIPPERMEQLSSVVEAVNSFDMLEVQRAFYKGGCKDANGHNIGRQLKRLEELHKGV